MRIIVGKFKGMTIEAPRGVLSRPPLAIIRESIFNIFGPDIEGKSVLDLYAGSGSLGIEAMSRGASRAHFVDSGRRCVDMIGRNTRKLGISDACAVSRQDAVGFIRTWQGERFDVVFIDPPFLSGRLGEVLAILGTSKAVKDGTRVVARSHWREEIPIPQGYSVVKRRKFGENVVIFLTRSRAGGAP
jgi:16S rRNA (guanine966-N2)-methyltransferase